MATVNRLARQFTHEGAPAPKVDLVAQLERSVMSCLLWEGEFYENGVSIAARIANLCSKIPADEVARIAAQAKQDMRLRHVPLLMTRELLRTKEGRAQMAYLLPKVILRPDDATELLSLYWKDAPDAPLAKQLKKHLGEAMRRFDEYQLQKYNGGQKAVKLRDVLRIARPKPANDNQAALWGRLVKGELATPDTWEVELSGSTDKKASWERLLRENRLGGMALLRNLRNMDQAGVERSLIMTALHSIKPGRLLPINFITAARHNPTCESAIEAKFFECFSKEKAAGRTLVLVDVSGSMNERLSSRSELTRMDVACSLAMIARETFQDISIATFSDHFVMVADRRGFALRDVILGSQPRSGTYLGQAVRQASAMGFSRLIVITDEQSADSVPQIKGTMINVASAQHGIGYGSWLHIDGWSDKIIDYLLTYEKTVV